MKKWLFFLACFVAVALLGGEGVAGRDVAKLEPVQTVCLSSEGEKIVLQTDTGAKGQGESLETALRHLQETTAGFAFLDTAEYLLVTPQQRHLIPQLEELLRPSCHVCWVSELPDLELVGKFLQIHQPEVTLKDYLAGQQILQTLLVEEEEMRLVS